METALNETASKVAALEVSPESDENLSAPPMLLLGDPRLRQPTSVITEFDAKLKEDCTSLARALIAFRARGLAAPQIGLQRRLLAVPLEVAGSSVRVGVFVNPKIVEKREEDGILSLEACLSLPGVSAYVSRAASIVVSYQDWEGNEYQFTAIDHEACTFQHEIDHLDGILFIDRLSGVRRRIAEDKVRLTLKQMRRRAN